ncbi:hypothetical protein COOONC_00123 [Cooperia oncophora]
MLLFKKVTLTAQSQRMDRLVQICRELLKRNPRSRLKGAEGENKNQFVLALEKIIYKGSPKEMELCLVKYYDNPENLREDVWRKAKDALNSRVRRLRKAIRDGQISTQNVDRENEFSRLDLYD